jgi:protein-S-isoprenylcysteine O-methyltransferase Ste14
MMSSLSPIEITGLAWTIWAIVWLWSARRVATTARKEAALPRVVHLSLLGLTFGSIYAPLSLPSEIDPELLPPFARWAGVLINLLGLAFAIWARRHLGRYWSGRVTIKEGHRIIRTGPYGLVRHPIYTGFVFGILGSAVALGRPRGVIAVVLALIAVIRKIKREERMLLEAFGDEYESYRREAKGLIPYLY